MTFKTLVIGIALVAGTYISSCKTKTDDNTRNVGTPETNTVDTTSPANTQAPINVAPYDTLAAGARDAVKSFPGVKADVENGEITLSGEIKRDQLQRLMMAVGTLKAKKINNNLTVK